MSTFIKEKTCPYCGVKTNSLATHIFYLHEMQAKALVKDHMALRKHPNCFCEMCREGAMDVLKKNGFLK